MKNIYNIISFIVYIVISIILLIFFIYFINKDINIFKNAGDSNLLNIILNNKLDLFINNFILSIETIFLLYFNSAINYISTSKAVQMILNNRDIALNDRNNSNKGK